MGNASGSPLRLHPLHESIGCEITGLDLSDPDVWGRDAGAIDVLRGAFADRGLLLIRGDRLPGETQVAFAARFGPLLAERGLWAYVSNVRADGIVREGALLFHSDFAFTRSATRAISLHALEVPRDGAPTEFADARRAVRMLPPDLRARLEGRRVLNVFDFHHPGDRPMKRETVRAGSPSYEHPVVARHPQTGAEVLMAGEMHTDCIVGLPPSESDAILRDVFAVLYDPGNVWRHRWSVGDLILWDNVALQHARRAIPLDEPRTLQRVVLGDYTPRELVPDLAGLLAAGHSAGSRGR